MDPCNSCFTQLWPPARLLVNLAPSRSEFCPAFLELSLPVRGGVWKPETCNSPLSRDDGRFLDGEEGEEWIKAEGLLRIENSFDSELD